MNIFKWTPMTAYIFVIPRVPLITNYATHKNRLASITFIKVNIDNYNKPMLNGSFYLPFYYLITYLAFV